MSYKTDLYKDVKAQLLFGEFSGFSEGYYWITVLAYDHTHACRRAVKRGYGKNHAGMYNATSEKWARFAVRLHGKSNHWRNIAYRGN